MNALVDLEQLITAAAEAGHRITVTRGPVGDALGRSWMDCTCGLTQEQATSDAASLAGVRHATEVTA